MLKALINVQIYDYDRYIRNGYIIFDNKIQEVGDMSEFKNHLYILFDGKGMMVLPNFVCAHSHIYSIFARGLSLPFDPKNFQEILDQMWWKLDSKIDNDISYYSAISAGYEFLLNGVTTVIDHHASGKEIIGSLKNINKGLDVIGLRKILCFETSDRFNVDDCIKENVTFAKKKQDGYTSGLFGMHASMSLSDDSLKKIKDKNNGLPIHIHVAESIMDEDDSLNKYQKRVVERLDDFGLIKPDSLIVHGVYMDEKEMQIVKDRGAYMVVNPTSNLNNAVGIADIKKFLDEGLNVLVGNDGLSSSMTTEYLNAYYLTHLKNDSPTALGLDDIKKMILNGYDYASKRLGIKLGKIDKNYEADFLTINYTPFTRIDDNNAFGHIFFGLFPNFRPVDVYVGGERLVKKGNIVSNKSNKEILTAKKSSSELWDRVK